MSMDITALYRCLDDFCKLSRVGRAPADPVGDDKRRAGKLSRAEMLFIMVLFHLSAFKHFKRFTAMRRPSVS